MKFTQENSEDGVTERFFELTVAGATVYGVIWAPDGARGPRPLLLMGHGGSQHKLFAPFAAYGKRYAKDLQYAVVAIDAPGHGARATPEETAQFTERFRRQMSQGEGLGGETLRMMLQSAAQAASEWRAVLDEVQSLDFVGTDGPVGYTGLSMGAMTGVLLAATEPRIKAAVFGLVGWHEEAPQLAEAATKLTAPVEFLVQWDDELVPRSAAMALFDAIGSAEKTLHANRTPQANSGGHPGGHGVVPLFERSGWIQFFIRHLGKATTPS
ncbi:MAG: alpha/beta fold hydrolase [Pseudomonadota bacterium]